MAITGSVLVLGLGLSGFAAALKDLPGIGDWTAQYIAMRALRWPDAFPAGDVALHKALGVAAAKNPAREAETASQPWKPWRSYAVIRAWSAMAATPQHPPAPAAPRPGIVGGQVPLEGAIP